MQHNNIEFWIDLNLTRQMAVWLIDDFGVKATSFKDLNFIDVADIDVYKIAAKNPN